MTEERAPCGEQKSDTPRCDAYARTCSSIDADDWAFMQQLERELAEARKDAEAFAQSNAEWLKENGPGGWIDNLRKEAAWLRDAYDHICMHIKFDDGLAYMPENEFPRLFMKLENAAMAADPPAR